MAASLARYFSPCESTRYGLNQSGTVLNPMLWHAVMAVLVFSKCARETMAWRGDHSTLGRVSGKYWRRKVVFPAPLAPSLQARKEA